MKKIFIDIYDQLKYSSRSPEEYYGHLITLSGMVYNAETDKAMENELKQLSIAYDNIHNSTLAKIKAIVHDIVFWTNNSIPDIEHQNVRQNRIVADFSPLIIQLGQLMKELKQTENYELNLPKIIGWLTQKGIELGYLNAKEEDSSSDE